MRPPGTDEHTTDLAPAPERTDDERRAVAGLLDVAGGGSGIVAALGLEDRGAAPSPDETPDVPPAPADGDGWGNPLARAGDLVQEVLASALVKWSRVSAADDPVACTNRMLVNAATSWRRRPSRRESAAVLDDERAAPDPHPAAEARSALRAAMASLPRRHRAVLVLRYLEDWSDDDIAAALGVAPSTVRSCARRGLSALRGSGALEGYAPAEPSAETGPSSGGRYPSLTPPSR